MSEGEDTRIFIAEIIKESIYDILRDEGIDRETAKRVYDSLEEQLPIIVEDIYKEITNGT